MTRRRLPPDLAATLTMRCASLDVHGRPHVVPLWFVTDDADVWVSTLAGSAKVRHLLRDPRATLLFDSGRHLGDLHGAMLHTTATVRRDRDTVTRANTAMLARYGAAGLVPDGFADVVAAQPRVALQFRPDHAVTWDNRVPAGPEGRTR